MYDADSFGFRGYVNDVDFVFTAAFSTTGKFIVTSGLNMGNGLSYLSVFDSLSGRLLKSLRTTLGTVTSVSFSHDDSRILTVSNDAKVKI